MTPIEIRFGGYQPPASVHHRAAVQFGAALAEMAGDAIDFRLRGNIIAEGRKAADLLTLVAEGELAMCYFASSYLSDLVPELALFGFSVWRESIVNPYRVIYRVEGDRVYVLAVFDGRRDLEDLLLGRLLR